VAEGIVPFSSASATESTMERVSTPKKNCEGFPMFLHLKIFKTAFMGDIKLRWNRRYRHRRRRYRRHRRSLSKVEKKRRLIKGKMLVVASKMIQDVEKRGVTVHSFVRILVVVPRRQKSFGLQ
jgi:hypothetical protein